jgi:signal transduction histidine kinase
VLKRLIRRVLGWVDAVFPVLLALLGYSVVMATGPAGPARWAVSLAAVIGALALYWRRRRPERVLLVTLLTGAVVQLAAPEQLFPYPALVALWALTARRPVTRSLPGLAGAIGVTALVVPAHEHPSGDVEFAYLVAVVVWALAWALRSQRQAIEQAGARIAMEEQSRLARDIHDVIAHSVSVIVVQAAAADDVFDTRPDRARQALRSIEETGRDALTELRRLLAAHGGSGDNRLGATEDSKPQDDQALPTPEKGPDEGRMGSADGREVPSGVDSPSSDNRLLRTINRLRPNHPHPHRQTRPRASLAPQPTLDRLRPDIIAPLAAAGLRTELAIEGDVSGISAGIQLTAFRIVQESLTNVLRHGRGAGARVRLKAGERELGIRVENVRDDANGFIQQSIPGGGRGIVGMRERAALVGGVLSAGPDDGGGFCVEARLPVRAAVRL